MRHDFHRPSEFHFFKGGLNGNGGVIALVDHFVTFGHGSELGDSAMMDANEFPALLVPNLQYGPSVMQLGVPTGPLRAPRSNALAFAFSPSSMNLHTPAARTPSPSAWRCTVSSGCWSNPAASLTHSAISAWHACATCC
jgi:isoquinoline 1-oxidoreductase beta subunit